MREQSGRQGVHEKIAWCTNRRTISLVVRMNLELVYARTTFINTTVKHNAEIKIGKICMNYNPKSTCLSFLCN